MMQLCGDPTKHLEMQRKKILKTKLFWIWDGTVTKCLALMQVFTYKDTKTNAVNPLYNRNKILYNVILICTEWLYCSKYVFFKTPESAKSKFLEANAFIVKKVYC